MAALFMQRAGMKLGDKELVADAERLYAKMLDATKEYLPGWRL